MIIAVCGYSDSGKTSFIEQLLSHLEGYRVAVIKHTDRERIDTAGKDTARYRAAGARAAALIASEETAVFLSGAGEVDRLVEMLDAEVVLLEGFKTSDYEKIWLGEGRGSNVVLQDPSVQAAISYIRRKADVERVLQQLPGLDCGDCGYRSCQELAQTIVDGDATVEDCVVSHGGVMVTVDGTAIPLKPFVQSFIEGTVRGMLQSLKGVEDTTGKTVQITLPGRP
ncbi:MAG: molybdopterin-guanine dinucleotide biosynthesis protein B [Thermoplasmatota archaeon]